MSSGNNLQEKGKFVIPDLWLKEDFIQIIFDHFKNINLLLPGISRSGDKSLSFRSNQQFWLNILNEQTKALKRVNLNKFQIVDWYPRSPGLFHTEKARYSRKLARKKIIKEDEAFLVYSPSGKEAMMQGGVGSIRFKPRQIEGENCWLCTATSDGYCHSGIPLAIPNRLINNIPFNSDTYFSITGKIIFLDDSFQDQFFSHVVRIPQIHILVESIKILSNDGYPVYITPMVFFQSHDNHQEHKVTYVTCQPNLTEIGSAVEWMEQYVDQYNGTIITDFDEQRRTFPHTKISLSDVMQGSASISQLSLPTQDTIEEINIIYNIYQNSTRKIKVTGNYNENIQGDYIQGDKNEELKKKF